MRRRRLRLPLTEAQRRIAAGLQGLATGSVESAPPDPPTNWAAVAVIVAPDPDAVLLIRRAERSGDPWSGHIGLPGGRLDPADQSLRDTALRETREETGLRGALLAPLDEITDYIGGEVGGPGRGARMYLSMSRCQASVSAVPNTAEESTMM